MLFLIGMSHITKISYASLFLVLSFLLILTTYPIYYIHLHGDINVFYNRASFFIRNLGLANLVDNEYQPGALLFFIILSPILIISNSEVLYLLVLFVANIFLVLLNAFIYSRYNKAENILIFSAVLLFTGPIIFYRFDLLVVTIVNLALLFWKKRHEFTASFLLGIGTQVKVYPLIFLPYLLILSYRKSGFLTMIKHIAAYILGLLSFLFLFNFLFKYNLANFFNSLQFHILKSVGLESPWATLITLFNFFTSGSLPQTEFSNGIMAISHKNIIGPLWLYNYIWIIPFILIHIWFFLKSKNIRPYLDIRFYMLNTLLLLIFSKVIAPQYILWFTLLIPFMNLKTLIYKKRWVINFLIIILICLLYQIIYPLNYSAWIYDFQKGNLSYLFLINTLRNFLMIIVAVGLFKDLSDNPA